MEQSEHKLVGHIRESLVNGAPPKPLTFILEDHNFGVGDRAGKHVQVSKPVYFVFALPGPYWVCTEARHCDNTVTRLITIHLALRSRTRHLLDTTLFICFSRRIGIGVNDSEPLVYLLNGQNSASTSGSIRRDSTNIRQDQALNAWNEWWSPFSLARYRHLLPLMQAAAARNYRVNAEIKGPSDRSLDATNDCPMPLSV